MWLPFTSLTPWLVSAPVSRSSVLPTHGPLALTTPLAETAKRARVAPVDQRRLPARAAARERHALGAGSDVGPPRMRVASVEHHQTRVLHPAIGVFERPAIALLQRSSAHVPAEIDARTRRQQRSPAEVVVEKQTQPDHPPGSKPGMMREHEAQRPYDVRGVAQQHLAFLKRVAHEAEIAVFQVAQSAVDQLGAGRRGVRGEVVLLAEQDFESPSRRVARDARTVDAAADDEQVDRLRPGIHHVHRNAAVP